jgi:hypothetical protein
MIGLHLSLGLGLSRAAGGAASTFAVLAADNTAYSTTRTALAADGTSYTVPQAVLAADGTSYSVL